MLKQQPRSPLMHRLEIESVPQLALGMLQWAVYEKKLFHSFLSLAVAASKIDCREPFFPPSLNEIFQLIKGVTG